MSQLLWIEIAARANIALSDRQIAQLHQYLDLLSAANEKMNLTRIVDRASAEVLHIADALTVLSQLPPGPHHLADVGSGGGVPGIVLAIARPDISITLIEATKKKASFLTEASQALGLSNVIVKAERVEDVGQGPLRESFEVAVCRAVATLVWLAEWMLPLVKKGGFMLAMKGPRVSDELPEAIKALRPLGGGAPEIIPAEMPGQPGHVLLKIQKMGRTDRRLPRPASAAKGNPLS